MDAPAAILYHAFQALLDGAKDACMNISMNIDCTPEEARRLMGLPDMAPIHDLYLCKMKETMTQGLTPETLDQMIRTWAPMGEVGMNAWRQLIEQLTGAATK